MARSRKTVRRKSKKARRTPKAALESTDPFRHVILLMLENRAFDHMMGALQLAIPAVDGVPPGPPIRSNMDPGGKAYKQFPGAALVVDPDPKHENPNVLSQLQNDNEGFVADYARSYPSTSQAQRQEIMAYHALDTLPALHTLGRSFAICDHWFSSVPGPTWTNRLFAMSGTSLGRVQMPNGIFHPNLHWYSQPSVFRRLREAKRSYKIYFGDFPLALLLADQRGPTAGSHFASFDDFSDDAGGDEAKFPDFCFIEPSYLGGDANDDHPPHDVTRGEELIASVYDALRSNDALWQSSLLVITFDEHGGFYDHVVPGPAVPPDDHTEEYTFDRLGIRVPALLVSPWLAQQVVKTEFDHTSLLRSLKDKWGLGSLGARVDAAKGVLENVTVASECRTDTPPSVMMAPRRRPARAGRPRAPEARLTDHELAILAFSEYLETRARVPRTVILQGHAKKLKGPAQARAVARERAVRFLKSIRAPL
jgi:phospholipase C